VTWLPSEVGWFGQPGRLWWHPDQADPSDPPVIHDRAQRSGPADDLDPPACGRVTEPQATDANEDRLAVPVLMMLSRREDRCPGRPGWRTVSAGGS